MKYIMAAKGGQKTTRKNATGLLITIDRLLRKKTTASEMHKGMRKPKSPRANEPPNPAAFLFSQRRIA
jgi:hypothetical protein